MATQQDSGGAGSTLMNFGGIGGTYSAVNNSGGQTFKIQAGSQINQITIGATTYGQDTGNPVQTATIPSSGVFTLYALSGDNYVTTYFKAKIGSATIEVGQSTNANLNFGANGIQVQFAGIFSGRLIDALQFTIVSL